MTQTVLLQQFLLNILVHDPFYAFSVVFAQDQLAASDVGMPRDKNILHVLGNNSLGTLCFCRSSLESLANIIGKCPVPPPRLIGCNLQRNGVEVLPVIPRV